MFRVTREINFCYGHRLLDYQGECAHLHGHNGRAVISMAAEQLDSLGMVLDFSEIKQVVSTWIDDQLYHRMILHQDDPVVPMLREMGEPLHLIDRNPTAENIAKLIYDFASESGFPVAQVMTTHAHLLFRRIHRWDQLALTVHVSLVVEVNERFVAAKDA